MRDPRKKELFPEFDRIDPNKLYATDPRDVIKYKKSIWG